MADRVNLQCAPAERKRPRALSAIELGVFQLPQNPATLASLGMGEFPVENRSQPRNRPRAAASEFLFRDTWGQFQWV